MNFILIILFVVVVVLAFLEEYLSKSQKMVILAILGLVMIVVASTKDIYHVADAENYMAMFYNNDDELIETVTEPSYIYLSRAILSFGGSFMLIFVVYSILSIPLKLYALNNLTSYVFTALVIYIPVYYELHDLVQIRAGAAAAFLLCSLRPIVEKKYIIATLLIFAALFMHYSSVLYFPLLFLGDRQLNRWGKIVCISLIPLGFAMYFMHMSLFSLIPSSLVGGKLDYYSSSAEIGLWGEMIVPYKNIFLLCKCLLLYVVLFYYDKIKDKSDYITIVVVLTTASIFIYLTMALVPTVATRISDLYGIVDPILFTYLLFIIFPKYVAKIGISTIGLYMVIYHMIIKDYFF